MQNQLDIATRLDRVESRFAIMDLVSAYCMACDDRDNDQLRTLFTEDAEFRSQDGVMVARGTQAIMEMYAGRFRALGVTNHWTHDHTVTFDDVQPDRAAGVVSGHAECYRNGQTLIGAMRYTDVYSRQKGVWKFSSRALAFLYYLPVQDYAEAMSGRMRQRAYGDRRLADYPEALATWTEGNHLPGT